MKIPVDLFQGPIESQNNKSMSFSTSKHFHWINNQHFKLSTFHLSIMKNEEDRKSNRFLVADVCVSLVTGLGGG